MRKVFVLAAALPSEGLMEQVHIRRQDGNSNLWWVSSPSGDDVAYITVRCDRAAPADWY
jgi:hypothetical protein